VRIDDRCVAERPHFPTKLRSRLLSTFFLSLFSPFSFFPCFSFFCFFFFFFFSSFLFSLPFFFTFFWGNDNHVFYYLRNCRRHGRLLRQRDRGPRPAADLPLPVFARRNILKRYRVNYRFLDLRRERAASAYHDRARIVDSMRKRMKEQGLFEFHNPACGFLAGRWRGFLVPSRHSPGRGLFRSAAGAAAVQAAPDDVRLRSLLPDRAFFRDEGSARRPITRREFINSTSSELCSPGRRVRGDGGRYPACSGFREGDKPVPNHGSGFLFAEALRLNRQRQAHLRNTYHAGRLGAFRGSGSRVCADAGGSKTRFGP